MAFIKKYNVDYFTTDINRNLRITSLMKFFEDMAIRQSESLNIGLDFYESEKVAWVMFKWDIRIYNIPKYLDEIEIITIPNAYKSFYANRLFKVNDSNGNLIAEGNSIWLFLDTETKRPKKIPQNLIDLYKMPDENKIVEIENPTGPKLINNIKDFEVRYFDIDTNDHVNNVQYVDWALEAIPRDIKDNLLLRRIKTLYKKEIKLGEKVSSKVEIIKNKETVVCHHLISNSEIESCILETHWGK